jgi:cytochrome bd-type quinol oxidase subunit 2
MCVPGFITGLAILSIDINRKIIAHKWNTGFSQLDHRICPILRQNKSLIGITISPASQINLAIPAESIRRSRLFNALRDAKAIMNNAIFPFLPCCFLAAILYRIQDSSKEAAGMAFFCSLVTLMLSLTTFQFIIFTQAK